MKNTIIGKKYIALLVCSGSIGFLIGQFVFQLQGYRPNEYSYIWHQLLFSASIGPFLVNYIAAVYAHICKKKNTHVLLTKEKIVMFTFCLIFGFLAVYIGLSQKILAAILLAIYVLLLC